MNSPKQKIYHLIPFLLCALCFSCNTSEQNSTRTEKESILSISKQVLTIEIDTTVINHTKFLSIYKDENENEYLAYANVTNKRNEILLFSLDTKKLVKTIPIEVEGPNGVGYISGFHIYDWNNIYVTSRRALFIAIVDENGKIKHKINYAKTNNSGRVFLAIIDFYNPMLFHNSQILLPILPEGSWADMTQNDLDKNPICLQIDTIKNEIKYLPFTMPNDYWREGKKDPVFSRIKSGDKFVYSFLGDNHLYVTQDHQQYEKYFAGSQFFEKTKPYPKDMSGVMDYIKYTCENSYYEHILYDEYRKVYYRFAKLEEPVKKGDNLEKLSSALPLFSVIVINESFRKIGEIKLPRNKFFINNAFVTKEGLYISNNHPLNTEMQDDKLSFTLFTLSSN